MMRSRGPQLCVCPFPPCATTTVWLVPDLFAMARFCHRAQRHPMSHTLFAEFPRLDARVAAAPSSHTLFSDVFRLPWLCLYGGMVVYMCACARGPPLAQVSPCARTCVRMRVCMYVYVKVCVCGRGRDRTIVEL